jgi:hypothetical protein
MFLTWYASMNGSMRSYLYKSLVVFSGLILFLKLRKVRSETASSEMRKVFSLCLPFVIGFVDNIQLYSYSFKGYNL